MRKQKGVPGDVELEAIASGLAPFSPRLILTGAGFSKPWGGYLSSELWSVIVSDPPIRTRPAVVDLLHRYLNFEEALAEAEVINPTAYTDEDRLVLGRAVTTAFSLQEERIRNSQEPSGAIVEFLKELASDSGTKCFFTLNEDLMMERFAFTGDSPRVLVPGVLSQDWWFGGQSVSAPWSQLASLTYVNDFDPAEFAYMKGRLSYVKLHGSTYWMNPTAAGNVAVLGGAKAEAIARFPILRTNAAIFRAAVRQPRARMLVIGYGFGDAHINQIILAGVEAGLSLWILDPRDTRSIKSQLAGSWEPIWSAVAGHSQSSFAAIVDRIDWVEGRGFRSFFWDD